MTRGALVAVVTLCLGGTVAGCPRGSPGAGPGALPGSASGVAAPEGVPAWAPEDGWRTCQAVGDCVRSAGDCCGCRGGGVDTAVAATHVARAESARAAACRGVVCPAVMGQDASCRMTAACREGRCVLEPPGGAPPGPSAGGVGVEPIAPGSR